MPVDEFGSLDWTHADDLIDSVYRSGDTELAERTANVYVDRAIDLVTPENDEAITPDARRVAATLTSTALYQVALADDPEAAAEFINARSQTEIHALVDALALAEESQRFNNGWFGSNSDSRRFSATALVLQFEGDLRTEQTDEFVRSVFHKLPHDHYHLDGIEDRFAEVITVGWGSDAESQAAEETRIADVLRTQSGRDLLAFNSSIPPTSRMAVASLFQQNPDWDADMLNSHDGNGWTNPTVMAAYTTPIAQDYVDLRGDAPVSLQNETLRNTIGFSIGLPADEAAGADANGVADGTVDAFGEQSAIIDPVAEAIQDVAGTGNPAEVTVLPVMFSDGKSPPRTVPLFRVLDGENNERFVDASGGVYDSFEEWEEESEMPPGNRTYPTNGHLSVDDNGVVELTSNNTPNTIDTNWEVAVSWLDTGATVGGLVAGGVLIVGTGGAATPFVAGVATAAGAWTTYRAGDRLYTHWDRGRDLNPVTSAQARGDWFEFSAGLLSLGAGGGQAARIFTGSARGATFVRGLELAAQGADTLATANDSYTLVTQWNTLSPQEKASLALSIAFWGAERIGPAAQGPEADVNNAVTVNEDGEVIVTPLSEDSPEWLSNLADGGSVPEFMPLDGLVAAARAEDGGLNVLVDNARSNGRLDELLDSGVLTRNDLQYLRITDSIDVPSAERALASRSVADADADSGVLQFTDMDAFNLAANNSLPDTTYEFGNYQWTTDGQGRTVEVQGTVDLNAVGRNDNRLQREIGNELGFEYDVGFHIVADRFGAPVNRLNVVSGNGKPIPGDPDRNLNGSAYKIFENTLAGLASAAESDPDIGPPEVRIELVYNDGDTTARPDTFVVRYREEGGDWTRLVFANKSEPPN